MIYSCVFVVVFLYLNIMWYYWYYLVMRGYCESSICFIPWYYLVIRDTLKWFYGCVT